MSIDNPSFDKWLTSIHPTELEIKETTEIACSASFFWFWTYISNLTTAVISAQRFMIKETTLTLISLNFPNLCSNMASSPAYGIYISQIIHCATASTSYSDFIERHKYLRLHVTCTSINFVNSILPWTCAIINFVKSSLPCTNFQHHSLCQLLLILKMHNHKLCQLLPTLNLNNPKFCQFLPTLH